MKIVPLVGGLLLMGAQTVSAATYYTFSSDVSLFDWSSVSDGGGDSLSEVFDATCDVRTIEINRQGGGTTAVPDYFAGDQANALCPDGRENYNFGGGINSSGTVAGVSIPTSEALGGSGTGVAWVWTDADGFTSFAYGFATKVVINDFGIVAGGLGFLVGGASPNPPGIRCQSGYYGDAPRAAFTWSAQDGVLNVNPYVLNLPASICAHQALAINNLGQILIRAVIIQDEGGPDYMAVLTPVPVPAAAWLLGSALAGLAVLPRRVAAA